MLLAFVLGWICLFSHSGSAAALQSISAQTLQVPPENFPFEEGFANAPMSSNQNASLLNATVGNDIRCHARYGFDPSVDDCLSAIRYIKRGWQIVSFADRQRRPNPEVQILPFRLMGDKALCYFQPILQVGATVGTASFNEIRTAANALLSQCATGQGQGGIATKLGMSFTTSQNALDEPSKRIGNSPSGWTLIFDRRRWQPCSHSRNIMNNMDVTSTNVVFGLRRDPSAQVIVPDTLSSSDDKCFAQISTTAGNSESSTWYKMWEAFTALYAVCGRHTSGGLFKGLGDTGWLSMTLYGELNSVFAA